ncbi:MAG: ATP cone domain-containing protein [Candidatus Paceibacterota bacterium]
MINSRKGKGEYEVWRRRKCFSCSTVFTTREVFSYDSLFVVKRNLNRKRFVYEKLFASILYSVAGGKMRDQGDEADEARVISGKIIKEILKINSKYISSKDIIRIAYSNLEKENHFFAMKYSLYSEFRLKTINEIKKM